MRRFVYLISPNKIDKNFYYNLDKVLSFKNVRFFQLRLKNKKEFPLIKISKKIKKITRKHKVKFIINDNSDFAFKIKADGCHIGQFETFVDILMYSEKILFLILLAPFGPPVTSNASLSFFLFETLILELLR